MTDDPQGAAAPAADPAPAPAPAPAAPAPVAPTPAAPAAPTPPAPAPAAKPAPEPAAETLPTTKVKLKDFYTTKLGGVRKFAPGWRNLTEARLAEATQLGLVDADAKPPTA